MASHPDRGRHAGPRSVSADGRRFAEAARAYELLMRYLLARPADRRASTESRRAAAARRPGAAAGPARGKAARGWRETSRPTAGQGPTSRRGAALYYRGSVPGRRLRLAEYLYYTGRVSWQSLISALVWQRTSQPRFGELARQLRSLSANEVLTILASRLRNERTGEAAQRLRILSAAQVERILRLQRARRRPIGRYFVEHERLSHATLASILLELYRHNVRCARKPQG